MCKNGFSRAFENSALDGHNDFRVNRVGESIYNIGATCNECPDKDACTSLKGLCSSSRTTTVQTTTTVSNVPSTTTTLNTRCPMTAMKTAFQNSAIDGHNNFRSLVARGLAENGKYVGINAPVAANMSLMNYDCTAEYFALKHVKSCDKQHWADCNSPDYKENIHILETNETSLNNSFVIQTAISTWASELKNNGIRLNMVFTPEVSRQKNKVTSVTKVWSVIV
ncbi:hypothetical protein KIN20_010221 [Parelaphostrongylus tenuis]|uniref:SCP domain-containing protein n=1 Tax=Parelaphostrongylus tenuis TaxID=148309 RepID=A0AAD5MC88_PARTN|nr:hypothetical protein KIN20_010221 [Parelaphostrongylus tenuis]